MKAKGILLLILILVLLPAGCSKSGDQGNKIKNSVPETITVNTTFRSLSKENLPVPGVTIMVIRYDGKVITKLVTNNNGEVKENITVPIDKRYPGNSSLGKRGTVTVIAFKKGYKDTVLFEVPICNYDSTQWFYINPLDPGYTRNEPDVQLASNHHLEILSLVEKYAPFVKAAK